MLSAELRAQAEKFISLLRANPALLHTPDFKFVKDFIESFGGTVPAAPPPSFKPPTDGKPEEPVPPAEPEPESEESEVELDTTGVIGKIYICRRLKSAEVLHIMLFCYHSLQIKSTF